MDLKKAMKKLEFFLHRGKWNALLSSNIAIWNITIFNRKYIYVSLPESIIWWILFRNKVLFLVV